MTNETFLVLIIVFGAVLSAFIGIFLHMKLPQIRLAKTCSILFKQPYFKTLWKILTGKLIIFLKEEKKALLMLLAVEPLMYKKEGSITKIGVIRHVHFVSPNMFIPNSYYYILITKWLQNIETFMERKGFLQLQFEFPIMKVILGEHLKQYEENKKILLNLLRENSYKEEVKYNINTAPLRILFKFLNNNQ